MPERVHWVITVSLFDSAAVLTWLGAAGGILFGIAIFCTAFAFKSGIHAICALGTVFALLIFSLFFILLFYRGKHRMEFIVDNMGICCETHAAQAKSSRIINALTVALAALTGVPAFVGAGMLAQSRRRVYIGWERVISVKLIAKSHIIIVRTGLTEQIALFCTKDSYSQVEFIVARNTCRPGAGSGG